MPQLVQEWVGQSCRDPQPYAVGDEQGEAWQDALGEELGRPCEVDGVGARVRLRGGILAGGGEGVERARDAGREVVSDRSGGDAAREPFKQLAPGLSFQGTDLRRHRRLGQAQQMSGGGEGADAVDGEEGTQQVEVRERCRTGVRHHPRLI